jgi:protein transport protein SEC61 subunit gamma and related proteins
MSIYSKLSRFVAECRRVLKVTRKPSWPEYTSLAKVTGLGILVIGLLGFLLTFAKQMITVFLG